MTGFARNDGRQEIPHCPQELVRAFLLRHVPAVRDDRQCCVGQLLAQADALLRWHDAVVVAGDDQAVHLNLGQPLHQVRGTADPRQLPQRAVPVFCLQWLQVTFPVLRRDFGRVVPGQAEEVLAPRADAARQQRPDPLHVWRVGEQASQGWRAAAGVDGGVHQHERLHTLCMGQCREHGDGAPGGIADQDCPLHPQRIQQPNRQFYLGLCTVRALACPLAGQRTLRQPEGGPVEGDDGAHLRQRLHHFVPGEEAGTEAMQQHEHRFTGAHHFVMDAQAVDLDELAVWVGQLLWRHSVLERWDGDQERADQHDGQQHTYDNQRDACPTLHVSLPPASP